MAGASRYFGNPLQKYNFFLYPTSAETLWQAYETLWQFICLYVMPLTDKFNRFRRE